MLRAAFLINLAGNKVILFCLTQLRFKQEAGARLGNFNPETFGMQF